MTTLTTTRMLFHPSSDGHRLRTSNRAVLLMVIEVQSIVLTEQRISPEERMILAATTTTIATTAIRVTSA